MWLLLLFVSKQSSTILTSKTILVQLIHYTVESQLFCEKRMIMINADLDKPSQ